MFISLLLTNNYYYYYYYNSFNQLLIRHAMHCHLRNVWLATMIASCCSSCANSFMHIATSLRLGTPRGGATGVLCIGAGGGGDGGDANKVRRGDGGVHSLTST